jgi:glyoxylase-like metal-dependent hydrolase (beta-lactamase superfamily II)
MLIKGFPAGSWATNAYVVAQGPGEPAIIIDPGQDSMEGINEIIRAHRLTPAAVILTHGHIDHIWSVAPVSAQFAIPALIHVKDRYRLADPAGSSFAAAREQLLAMTKGELELTEPSDVEVIEVNKSLNIAGVDWEFIHAPGHTEGSMVIRTDQSGAPIAFTGDVLFAGSIGRTDLPGGDSHAMQKSLENVILPMPDHTLVYPGHGSDTTIGAERETNPFLSTGRGI